MTKKNAFQKAVENTPEISTCYQAGLKALGGYKNKIKVGDTSLLSGSVELDGCVLRLYPGQNRWDFIICYDFKAYFMEVHSAYTSEVSTMINKLNWLKTWLNEKAPEINKMKAKNSFFWVQSGNFAILKNSRQYRLLEQNGLLPIPVLKLG